MADRSPSQAGSRWGRAYAARGLRRVSRSLDKEPTAQLARALFGRLGPGELPTERILVVTHHKTGTVWMCSIFEALSADLGLRSARGAPRDAASAEVDVFLVDRGDWDPNEPIAIRSSTLQARTLPPGRGVHLVRDPRDVIVSGCKYHQSSDERWLHIARPELEGRTYSQAINALDTDEEKLLFELEHFGATTVAQMLEWDSADPRFLEFRYEDLVADVELRVFHDMFTFLGFRGRALAIALAHAWKHSLFGARHPGGHVRSGSTRQFEEHFTAAVHAAFNSRFPDAVSRLGYA